MPRSYESDGWKALPAEVQGKLEIAILQADHFRERIDHEIGEGEIFEIYAWPRRSKGDVEWGVNGPPHGFNIARGMLTSKQIKEELIPQLTLQIVRGIEEENPTQQHSLEPFDLREAAILELQRRMAADLGFTPPRAEVLVNAEEAAIAELNPTAISAPGQSASPSITDLSAAEMRLEPHEVDRLDELRKAGTDENAFHDAFSRLRDDPSLTDDSVVAIAHAYSGTSENISGRNEALGAIEDQFYRQKKHQMQAQQQAGRSAHG
jgi:hypothetical protein